ncbi:MerR family transcriptional regulator [Sphingomonas sp.]|uniref:MerR family transcriptional regulator n=1 Tax=Sphingomonas sp. TaxID=28214 RepID=UPI001B1FC8B8|nr:MerR family transcriptional regulator [Sphingomonas sp.]MBO9714159.1 MerR family transcriptional regulator [Sphingomonas sp.]
MPASEKAAGALRTIGELAQEIGRPQHILRYWETRFPQLRPLTRAGNRRYYRPEDVALVRRIHALLTHEGYTIRGVQRLLAAERSGKAPPAPHAEPTAAAATASLPSLAPELRKIRDTLSDALDSDG